MVVHRRPSVAVVIPVYNEQDYIADTLDAVRRQRFRSYAHREILQDFKVIVVNNNSTDNTAALVESYKQEFSGFNLELVDETEKGSGCAADTGARHAISDGAKIIARTDADSLPAEDWLAALVDTILSGKRLVGGRVRARHDEGLTSLVFNGIGSLWHVGHALEWYKTRNKPVDERRSFAVVGNNMAIDAEMYEQCGGFPRTRMDDVDDDSILQRRVRASAGPEAIALQPKAVVYTSLRRLHAYGVRDFIAWYNDADRTGKEIDVR